MPEDDPKNEEDEKKKEKENKSKEEETLLEDVPLKDEELQLGLSLLTEELLQLSTGKEVLETAKKSPRFKLHISLAVFVALVTFVVWLIIDISSSTWPWFILFIGFFGVSISFHYFVYVRKPKDFLRFHFASYCIINGTLILTWFFTGDERAWFLYPLFLMGILFTFHLNMRLFQGRNDKWLNLHKTMFVMINLFLFLVWMDVKGYPFFFIPFFATSAILLIHNAWHTQPYDWFKTHLYIFVCMQLLMFFVWATNRELTSVPWFIFVLVGWGAILIFHFRYHKPPPKVVSNAPAADKSDAVGA